MLDRLSNQFNSQEINDVEDGVRDFNQKLSGCIKIRCESSQIQGSNFCFVLLWSVIYLYKESFDWLESHL